MSLLLEENIMLWDEEIGWAREAVEGETVDVQIGSYLINISNSLKAKVVVNHQFLNLLCLCNCISSINVIL